MMAEDVSSSSAELTSGSVTPQHLNILTLFPEAVMPYFGLGVTGRAIERELIKV
jgi:hypothetical protein